MRPLEWYQLVLKNRGLEKPVGQPLYQYRLTDSEFSELKQLMELSSHMGISHIVKMLYWDACFVFYASEWWRRYYKGKWGWDGIFDSIGIDYSELSSSRRNDLIETGLYRWRRDIRLVNGARRFLGTIATEGGLPLHQLSETGGWIKGILSQVLKKHLSRGISIAVLIEGYGDIIPRSYRSSELDNILADILEIVVRLRAEHQLMSKDSPLTWLDSNVPEWREQFPLPIDDESGKSLLSDLVDTASAARDDKDIRTPFVVERYLVSADSQFPELQAQIEIPTFVSPQSIGFDIAANNATAVYELEAYEPGGSVWPWCRALLTTYKGEQVLKLSGRSFRLTKQEAIKEVRLRLKSVGEIYHEFEISNGSNIDTELPWLFRQVDSKWILQGTASQSIKDKSAILYIPGQHAINIAGQETEVTEKGSIYDGKLHSLVGVVETIFEDAKYKLSTGIDESIIRYHLTGRSFPFGSNPKEVFIGLPSLVETNSITGLTSRRSSQELVAKPLGVSVNWQPLSESDTGNFEVRLLDQDRNILFCKRIGILEQSFSYHLKPDLDSARSGLIKIHNPANAAILFSRQGIVSRISTNMGDTDIRVEASDLPPISIDITYLAIGHNRELLLTFPFPSKGALLYDGDANQKPFSESLYLNNLKGFRIKVFDESFRPGVKADIEFSLNDRELSFAASRDICIRRNLPLSAELTEYSIYDWVTSIESLLSVSTSLDSSVKVSMVMHGQEIFKFHVYRYERELTARWQDGVVEFESMIHQDFNENDLENCKVSALYLRQPEQRDYQLLPGFTQSVFNGQWSFSPENRQEGPWLIYPLEDSFIKFRPLLWVVGNRASLPSDEVNVATSLQQAIDVSDVGLRADAIGNVLRLMSEDKTHKSWAYLEHLWEKTNHLPMATLDIWKIAIGQPGFMASLLINNYDDMLERLRWEFPLIWELVLLQDWEVSLRAFKNKIASSLEDENELIDELVRKKISKIESLELSMTGIGKILRLRLLGEMSPELQVMSLPVTTFLAGRLNEAMEDLFRSRSDHAWPVFLSDRLVKILPEIPAEITEALVAHNDHHVPVVFLPLALAWRALSKEQPEWPQTSIDYFKIQQLKTFNEDWFNEVFQYSISWLSQQEL